MARDPAHAGELRERVSFQRQGLDANGVRNGPFQPFFECQAKIETSPSPTRIAAQALEGQSVIQVTIRGFPNREALALDSSMRMTWQLNGKTYLLREPEIAPRRAWITFMAYSPAGGA